MSQKAQARRHIRGARALTSGAIILLFLLFELGVRQIPPNTLEHTAPRCIGCGMPVGKVYRITDARTVANAYASIRTSAWTPVNPLDILLIHCNGPYGGGAIYRFTWHGLPVTVASDEITGCQGFIVSSGGLPDPWLYHAPISPF